MTASTRQLLRRTLAVLLVVVLCAALGSCLAVSLSGCVTFTKH